MIARCGTARRRFGGGAILHARGHVVRGHHLRRVKRKQPLFPGDSERSSRCTSLLLGTPARAFGHAPARLHEFPQWKQQDLHKVIPQLDKDGIDCCKMLVYDPARRIHATDALDHPYFDSLDKSRYAKIEAQFEKENRAMN